LPRRWSPARDRPLRPRYAAGTHAARRTSWASVRM
jgi:hypothetical protein